MFFKMIRTWAFLKTGGTDNSVQYAAKFPFAEPAVFTFSFEGAGEIVSEFGGDTGVQVTYTNPAVEAIGGTAGVHDQQCR